MTVLGIIAILSVMSITGVKFFSQKTTADILSSQLINAIHLTRSEAIARQENVFLCGSADQSTCSNDWSIGYLVRTKNKIIYHFQTLAENSILHWRTFPAGSKTLEFLTTGFPNTENGTFWFCQSSGEKPLWAIVMNQSGRVRMVYPDQNGNIVDDKGARLLC